MAQYDQGEIIADATCESIPESVYNYFKNAKLDNINYYVSMCGITADEYCSTYMGVESIDTYFEQNREAMEVNCVTYLAVQAISELEGITVTDEDITASGYEGYIESCGVPYIRQYLLNSEVVPELVIGNAIIK